MTTELETLRAELAETRAVLEDLLNEKRPGETWLLKLLGRRADLVQVVRDAYDHKYSDCVVCFSELCDKDCFRFEFLAANDAEWLAGQIDKAHKWAIEDDRRRFPMYGPPNRPRNYAYQRSALSRLFQEAYSQDIVTAWGNAALLIDTNTKFDPHIPDGTAYIMPNMDALDGPAPIRERSEPESHRLERESDKKTDTEPQA